MARAKNQDKEIYILQRSSLQGYKEFYVMFKDIEEYHRKVKFRALSASKDRKRDLDLRPYLYDDGDDYDKSFYRILIRMLIEVNSYVNKDKQQQDLRKVYAWFQANKHLLSDNEGIPHFLSSGTNKISCDPNSSVPRRPMSSLDGTLRSGVLRYTVGRRTSSLGRNGESHRRAGTASPRLLGAQSDENHTLHLDETKVLSVTQVKGISPPELSQDAIASHSLPADRSPPKLRPRTAPASVNSKDQESNSDHNVVEAAVESVDAEITEQRPVSKVSVQYLDDHTVNDRKIRSPSPVQSEVIHEMDDDTGRSVPNGDMGLSEEAASLMTPPCEKLERDLGAIANQADINVSATNIGEEADAKHYEEEASIANDVARADANQNIMKSVTVGHAITDQLNDQLKVSQKSLHLNGDVGARFILEMATPVGKKIMHMRENQSNEVKITRRQIERPDTDISNATFPSVAEVQMTVGEIAKPYNVHFSHKPPQKSVQHYRTSGPVEPESLRYRWKDDGNGGRTYVKKLSRGDDTSRETLSRRNSRMKMSEHNCSLIRTSTHKRLLDPKSLASLMIIRHLGFMERRAGDKVNIPMDTKPVWIEDDQDYMPLSAEYLSFTKGLELRHGYQSRNGERRNSEKHMRVKLPYLHYKDKTGTSAYSLNGHMPDGKEERFKDASTGQDQEDMEAWPGEIVKIANDSDEILRRIIEESKGMLPAMSDDEERRLAAARQPEVADAFLTEARGSALRLEPKPPPGSVTYSRPPSSKSRHTIVPSEDAPTPERRELTFNVSQFHHFCFDDNPDLDYEYRLQMEVNAAVDIQRIFRGHMARKYKKELEVAEKERQRKAAVAVQSAMRGYLTRKRLMEENIRQREPTVATYEWAKEYKEKLKKKEIERKQKLTALARKENKIKSVQEGALKKVTATEQIYDLFHDKSPTKAQMRAAAITIQRYVRGWLVRKYLAKAKTKAMKRTLDFHDFINNYRAHLIKIMERHGVQNGNVVVAFNELLEYIEKRNKYEVEFDRIAKGGVISYQDIKYFFEACKTCPANKEINDAIKVIFSPEVFKNKKEHKFTKAEVVDIAFHIFVPKGTKLTDTRKSTWLNPLANVDEKTKLALSKKVKEQTDFNTVFRLVSGAKAEREEMQKRAIDPQLLPEDAKRAGFVNVAAESQPLKNGTTKHGKDNQRKQGASHKLKGRPSSSRRKPTPAK